LNGPSIAEKVLKDLKNEGFAIINYDLKIASKFLFPGAYIIGPERYYQYFLREFHAARQAANITDRRLHDLRRTFATELYLKYHDLPAVSKALGHQSIYTTEIYLGLDPIDIRDLFIPVKNEYSQKELETIQFS
jgi:integrase